MRLSRRWFLAGLAVAVATAAAPTSARMHAPYRGHRIVAANAAPPLDGLTTPSGAYSFRKLRSAYAGPAIRIRRASDNAELDINFLGFVPGSGAPVDGAAAASHCASTTCFIRTWYDQSGNARDLVQTTAANQPQLIFNCNNFVPCFRTTLNTHNLSSVASITPATGVVSFSVVMNRSNAVTGFCTWLRENAIANRIGTNNVLNQWSLNGGTSGAVLATAADLVWHSVQGIVNGASSSVNVDGTNTTGAATGNTTAGTAQINGGAGSTNCDFGEAIDWDNYILTAGEQAALRASAQGFFGTP